MRLFIILSKGPFGNYAMVPFSDILFIAGLHLAVAISPGPNTFAICATASSGSRRQGLCVAAGVVAGTGLWIAVAMLGVGAILSRHDGVLDVLRGAAALYLMGFGLRMLASPPAGFMGTRQGPSFALGLLTALTNPLAMAFWLGAFLAAIPADAPSPVYLGIFLVIMFQSAVWYSFLAVLFSSTLRGQGFPAARVLRFIAGAAMILVGLNVLRGG